MGLPQILIKFKTAGSTAIRRSARGQVVLLVPGGGQYTATFFPYGAGGQERRGQCCL